MASTPAASSASGTPAAKGREPSIIGGVTAIIAALALAAIGAGSSPAVRLLCALMGIGALVLALVLFGVI